MYYHIFVAFKISLRRWDLLSATTIYWKLCDKISVPCQPFNSRAIKFMALQQPRLGSFWTPSWPCTMQLLGRRICHVFVARLIKRLLSVFSIDARFMWPSVHPSMCPVASCLRSNELHWCVVLTNDATF